jgi:hypothetical protein
MPPSAFNPHTTVRMLPSECPHHISSACHPHTAVCMACGFHADFMRILFGCHANFIRVHFIRMPAFHPHVF